MNRNKEFLKNTVILFIGKFASQFMSLLLLPLFTHCLITEDYGMVDLFQTYISLFVPVLTLRMDSAVFRYLVEKRKCESGIKEVISNVVFLLFIGLSFTLLTTIILLIFIKIQYAQYLIINLLILMMSNVLLQILRGLGNNRSYSFVSIITGVTSLLSNVILIIVLKKGAESILISSSLANLICIIYVITSIKLFKYIDIKVINKNKIKELLKYSLPMIPNSLSWWIVHVSDRTVVSFFLGVAYNAVYAIACKFSSILNSIFNIFNMSWQETTSLHIDDKDKDIFFSNMINKLVLFFGMISLLIIGILPFIYDFVIGKNYVESYKYIPLLLYANIGNVLSTLIGGIYLALKKTKEIATTTIISAIINIVVNLILIKYIGLYAAVISTLISYVYLCIYRYIDSKKYLTLKLNFKKMLLFTSIYTISSFIYLYNNCFLNIINLVIIIMYSYLENKKLIKEYSLKLYKKCIKI